MNKYLDYIYADLDWDGYYGNIYRTSVLLPINSEQNWSSVFIVEADTELEAKQKALDRFMLEKQHYQKFILEREKYG
jgi:hypothetical protein